MTQPVPDPATGAEDRTLATRPDYRVLSLLGPARGRRLLIYTGAGISLESGLPTGAALSRELHARLSALGLPLTGIKESDLLAVADAVGVLPYGVETLQATAIDAFNFTTARPSSTHRALALLLLEGAIQILTTNWDTCIERATPERVVSVVTSSERQQVRAHSLLKVHGCADRADTLLVTTQQLANPPLWATTEIGAALSQDTVVFLGIGDVAPYVQLGLKALLKDMGSVEKVRVVQPSIEAEWDESKWSKVLPSLPEGDRWGLTGEAFSRDLLAAWVNDALTDVQVKADTLGVATLTSAVGATIDFLRRFDAERVVTWLRRSHTRPQAGQSVARDGNTCQALIALAAHASQASWQLEAVPVHGPLHAGHQGVELVIASETVAATTLAQDALARVKDYQQTGELGPEDEVDVVCTGHFGALPMDAAGTLPVDLVADPAGGIVSGGRVRILDGGDIIKGVAA